MARDARVVVTDVTGGQIILEEVYDRHHGGAYISLGDSHSTHRILMRRDQARRLFQLGAALAAKEYDDPDEDNL